MAGRITITLAPGLEIRRRWLAFFRAIETDKMWTALESYATRALLQNFSTMGQGTHIGVKDTDSIEHVRDMFRTPLRFILGPDCPIELIEQEEKLAIVFSGHSGLKVFAIRLHRGSEWSVRISGPAEEVRKAALKADMDFKWYPGEAQTQRLSLNQALLLGLEPDESD